MKKEVFLLDVITMEIWIVRCLMNEIFGEENFRNEIIVNRTIGYSRRAEKSIRSRN
jgi:adenine specific DNA methylase Mod